VIAAGLGALAAVALVLFATGRYGPGLSPDSAVYLSTAENAATGHGFVSYTGHTAAEFPPGFSAVLAAVSWVTGASVVTAARIVNALALGTVVIESSVLLRRHVASVALRIVGVAAAAAAQSLVYVATWAWSEPLFVALALGAIVCLEVAVADERGRRWTVAAALLAAAAFATRYLGLAAGVAGVVVLADERRLTRRVRAARVAVFSSIFALASGAVIAHNIVATSTLTGPRGSPQIAFAHQLHATATELARWLVPRGLSDAERIVALGLAGVFVCVFARPIRKTTQPARVLALLAFGVAYLVMLEGSAASTSLDAIGPRLLAPLFVPLLVVALQAIDRFDERVAETRAAPVVGGIVVLAAAWAALSAHRGVTYARAVRDVGAQYSSVGWRSSAVARFLRSRGVARDVVYSDDPAAVWATTHLRARCLPPQLTPYCGGLEGDPADLPRLLANRHGVELAWFNDVGAPPEPVLRGHPVTLHPLTRGADGTVYLLTARR
jgi:hypothetical protein